MRANAIVTSANDALCGNDQPLYWRFTNQRNVGGAVRKIAGPGPRRVSRTAGDQAYHTRKRGAARHR